MELEEALQDVAEQYNVSFDRFMKEAAAAYLCAADHRARVAKGDLEKFERKMGWRL